MNTPWCQRGTGKAERGHPHALWWNCGQGHPRSRETHVFLGRRGEVGFIRISGLTSHPHRTALAPTWTLRDFVTRMTLMCRCLSVTVLHPLRNKERQSDMFCGQQIPTLNVPVAQPAPCPCPMSPAVATTLLSLSPPQAAVLRGAYQPTRALPQTHC